MNEKEKPKTGTKAEIRDIDSQNELYVDSEVKVVYDRGSICIYSAYDNKAKRIRLYESGLINFLAKFRMMERLLRLEPRSVIRRDDGDFLISSKGVLYRYDSAQNSLVKDFQYAAGTTNPLSFCMYNRNGCQELVFGDYGGHDESGRVGIYVWRDGTYRELSSFKGDVIDHIHRVEYDSFRDCYWAFTGDFDSGCGIWKVDYISGEITPFLVGKQSYRACVAVILEKSILYATDSPLEQNYIYELDLATKQLKTLYEMPGPCIYGMTVKYGGKQRICLATSVEGNSSLKKWQYRFSNKPGPGVKDRYSHIILGDVENGFEEIYKNKKDRWNMWLFQFGNHRFPTQSLDGEIRFVPQSCTYKNGHTLAIDLKNK